jgi:hypothetical protein
MTMGPEPMIRILLMSVRLGMGHPRMKFQFPNPKFQIDPNLQFSTTQTVCHWVLVIGAYLKFDAWNLVLTQ